MDSRNIPWSITQEEMQIAERSMEMALKAGASQVRITLNKSIMDLFNILNGELDKVSHSGDRSMSFNIFACGKYGSFSTNRINTEHLDAFVKDAVDTVKMLAEDEFRKLPPVGRTAKDALTGLEAGLYDGEYAEMNSARRIKTALSAARFGSLNPENCKVVSEEMEYSDSIYDNYTIDSNGLKCRHIESSFEIGCETTVEDEGGHKYSGYWWDSTPSFAKLDIQSCCERALQRAVDQIGPVEYEGGRFNMVVENEVASKLLNPILKALNGFSIQQQNSFLTDSIGRRVFPEALDIMDKPREYGANGARFYDSEGVATKESYIIKDGTVVQYFINTYMSGKMGMEPTIEDSTRAVILPYLRGGKVEGSLDAVDMIKSLGKGIFVTGFNGGNNNSATGDFSYGVEGFAFEDGKITKPVRGMVITGNFIDLWNKLVAAGTDARSSMNKIIPSLAFENVDFSA